MNPEVQFDKLQRDGWCRFAFDAALEQWVEEILPAARACVTAPENEKWRRCGDTWFVGVNALPNGPDGSLAGGMPLAGDAVDFIREKLGLTRLKWDRAQVSLVRAGYPKQMAEEADAAFRYRLEHDAAHIDGLIREGPRRRRYLRNFHRFILGIPTCEVTATMSPFVVWEGSHEYVRRAFRDYFGDLSPERWSQVDVTKFYHDLRRDIFAACNRVAVTARGPGEAYLVHRLALHGIAPWDPATPSGDAQRMIVYFRPESDSAREWLEAP